MAGTLGVLLTMALIAPSGAASPTSPSPGTLVVTLQEPPNDAQAPQETKPSRQPPPAGHVKQRDGQAAGGAKVVASHPEGGKLEVFADSNGKFELKAPAGKTLLEGDYSLEILFQKKTAKFASKLEDGQLTPDEFELP